MICDISRDKYYVNCCNELRTNTNEELHCNFCQFEIFEIEAAGILKIIRKYVILLTITSTNIY